MRHSRLVALPVVVAASAGALIAAAGPAAAGEATPTPYVVVDGVPQRDADATGNVAGYVASLPTAARHSIVGTFTVPTVTCTTRTQSPLFVTISLFGTATGTTTFDYASADLTVTCTQGVPFYQASVSTNPERQVGAVSPGDKLTARVTVNANKSVVVLTDTTSGGVFRTEGNGLTVTAAQTSVQGGFEGQTFPRFGAVPFQGIRIDGAAFGTFTPTSFDQVNAAERVLLQTTTLNSQLSFGVRFRGQP